MEPDPNIKEAELRAVKALQIHLVWGKVTAELSTRDALTLRRTCQPWNRILVPVIRRNHNPIFFRGPETLAKYTALMRSSRLIPLSKYVIRDLFGTMNSCCGSVLHFPPEAGSVEIFRDFVAVSGGETKSLWIGTGRSYRRKQREDISEIRRPVFEHLHKLTELTLSLKSWSYFDWPEPPVPLRNIPNLKRLVISHCNSVTLVPDLIQSASRLDELILMDPSHISRALGTLRDRAANLNRLTTLELHCPTTAELTILLELAARQQKPLRLKTFRIQLSDRVDLDPSGVNVGVTGAGLVLSQFLVTQSKSLNELSLLVTQNRGRPENEIGRVCIPKLVQLHTLQIWQPKAVTMVQRIQLKGQSIADTFPKLKKLSFDTRDFKWDEESEVLLDDHTHAGVSDLTIIGDPDLAGGRLIQNTANSFSSVTTCDITLLEIYGVDLHVIWTAWPLLRVLRLTYLGGVEREDTLQLDEFLSGILKSQFQTLNQKLWAMGVVGKMDPQSLDLDTLGTLSSARKTKAGLSDLRHLRELDLNIGSWNAAELQTSLTDIGGYFGFAMASPYLQRITLRLSCFEQGDNEATPVQSSDLKMGFSAGCLDTIQDVLGPSAIIQLTIIEYRRREDRTFSKKFRTLQI